MVTGNYQSKAHNGFGPCINDKAKSPWKKEKGPQGPKNPDMGREYGRPKGCIYGGPISENKEFYKENTSIRLMSKTHNYSRKTLN